MLLCNPPFFTPTLESSFSISRQGSNEFGFDPMERLRAFYFLCCLFDLWKGETNLIMLIIHTFEDHGLRYFFPRHLELISVAFNSMYL